MLQQHSAAVILMLQQLWVAIILMLQQHWAAVSQMLQQRLLEAALKAAATDWGTLLGGAPP
jgi:hypothetical protein